MRANRSSSICGTSIYQFANLFRASIRGLWSAVDSRETRGSTWRYFGTFVRSDRIISPMQLLITAPRYVYISTGTPFLMWVKINETQASGTELSVETIGIALFGKIFAIFYDILRLSVLYTR